jgi:hypothetical protein
VETKDMKRARTGGQALVVAVIAMIAIIAGMGLIIDGGNAFAQQRITQAANDAASEAGATVINQHDVNPTAIPPAGNWDAEVAQAVTTNAGYNDAIVDAAYYTDICGTLLRPDGTKASGTADAALVGASPTGTLPINNHTDPDCPSGAVGPVAGVVVYAHRTFDTWVSRVVSVTSMTTSTNATAVSGLLQSCTISTGCIVLPVTAPVTIVTCDGSNNPVSTSNPWPKGVEVKVPLCKNGPGNVGWLDWTPKAGGTSELVNSILTPDNPPIDLPSWNYVTATGNINSKSVEDALNTYMGQVVMFPMFDLTCGSDPDVTKVKIGPTYGCSDVGGNGSNQWYRIPVFASFELKQAYINGSNSICDTGNGATACLVGTFVDFQSSGTVGPGIGGGSSDSGVRGVQLIK